MSYIKIGSLAMLASLSIAKVFAQSNSELGSLTVSGYRDSPSTQSTLFGSELSRQSVGTSNTAQILQNIPGVSMYTSGGVSGLPAIHGLADDRVRTQVDGLDLLASCPNHMNAPLSYISPSNIQSVTIVTGLSPVSMGGDSLGGVISVKSLTPQFAEKGQTVQSGEVGGYYSTNASALAGNVTANMATENFTASYSINSARADNYTAGGNFKPPATYSNGVSVPGNVVAASGYIATNQQLSMAYQQDNHLIEFKAGYQFIPFEGFPNQRMDLTKNQATDFNLKYTGKYDWGLLEAQAYNQMVNHQMEDNVGARTSPSMPMLATSSTNGVNVKGTLPISENLLSRVGALWQGYKLNDWWPASSTSPGNQMMGPNTFQNINNGTRDRLGLFGELEQQWTREWMGLVGLRLEQVGTNAGNVQGYNNANTTSGMMGMTTNYQRDANAFNAEQHRQTNLNWDLTALSRYNPDQTQNYELGYSRKTRSPNLYERYSWSTTAMAAIMNNFVGDGNGYVGNVNLSPEVANTISFASDWHDDNKEIWGFKSNPYYTFVNNYIDAVCSSTSYSAPCKKNQFNVLQYANQTAQIYGIDLSGNVVLGKHPDFGRYQLTGLASYTRGQNLTSGDNLYNIMPINGKLSLVQKLGANWTNSLEGQFVAAKTNLNAVRNEIGTAGYSLFNLRASYEDKQFRINFGIENLLNKMYSLPLGGAYLGQGDTMAMNKGMMAPNGPVWGAAVAGMGRTVYVSMNVKY